MATNDPKVPTCDKCGVEVTTGAMALICPLNEQCEFYPDDEESQRFVREWKQNMRGVGQSTDPYIQIPTAQDARAFLQYLRGET